MGANPQELARSLAAFVAILNPFALSLYLLGIMEVLPRGEFVRVLLQATLVSLAVFLVFAASGEFLLIHALGVDPAALRVFGGVIFVIVAYGYVVRGYRATEMLRGDLDELPSAIALPFMIGAGTITQAILIGKRHDLPDAALVLFLSMVLAFCVVMAFKVTRDHMSGVRERIFVRYVNIAARINGLVIGAISIEMIVGGLKELWIQPPG